MKLVIRAPHRADRLQQFLSAERISIFSGEREWPSWEVPSLRDVLVAPPCLGLAHLESPTADVNTPSRKQKEIGGDHGAHNRHYVRLIGAHKCRYVALLLYPWVVWGGLTRVAPCLLLGFWAV